MEDGISHLGGYSPQGVRDSTERFVPSLSHLRLLSQSWWTQPIHVLTLVGQDASIKAGAAARRGSPDRPGGPVRGQRWARPSDGGLPAVLPPPSRALSS